AAGGERRAAWHLAPARGRYGDRRGVDRAPGAAPARAQSRTGARRGRTGVQPRRRPRPAQHRPPPGLALRPAGAGDGRLERRLLCLRDHAAAAALMTSLKLVIADDEPMALERLRLLLAEEPGVEVVAQAADGQQVLDACAAHRPDAVLLDIAMPGQDGLQAARRLAGSDPPVAVVFCTAYDAHALSAFDAAAIDYLVKPVRPERLAAALARVRTFLAGRLAA